jgi:hypothetical protein
MSRFEFDPATHEPFRQEPPNAPERAPMPSQEFASGDGSIEPRKELLQPFNEPSVAGDRDASL